MTIAEFAEHCQHVFVRRWVEVDGCVVIQQPGIDKHVKRMISDGCSRKDVEITLNHQHVSLVLGNLKKGYYSKEHAGLIARILRGYLKSELCELFPGKEFIVMVSEEDEDVAVLCYQNTTNESAICY